MAALDIDATPMTQEQIFEREQAIEERWLEQFREQEEVLRKLWESRDPMRTAQAKIGEAAQSTLHNKGVVIPSLYNQSQVNGNVSINNTSLPDIDDNAVIEVVDATITYITMGRDFEIILQAIKENPTLMSQWEQFLMMLRMSQDD